MTMQPLRTEGTAAAAETLAAGVASVLAVLGLAGVAPATLLSIATIAVGIALLTEPDAGAWYEDAASPAAPLFGYGEERVGRQAERLGGAAGVVLGIAALIGIIPFTFASVALIGFGGSLLLGSLARRRLALMGTRASSEGDVLAGFGAVVLGYLSLIGFGSVALVLVGVLGVGLALLFSGSTLLRAEPLVQRLP